MSNFAAYCLAGLLRSMGWPHTSGFLRRREVVDPSVVDVAAVQMVQIGVGLGAGKPHLAIRFIADAFQDREWSADGAEELLDFLDVSKQVADAPDQPPWRTIAPSPLATIRQEPIPWEWLGRSELTADHLGSLAQGVFWGFLHPLEAERALDADRASYEERAPEARKRGLEVSPDYAWSTNEDFYRNAEELVANFEAERRPLADAPPQLLAEPRVSQRLERTA